MNTASVLSIGVFFTLMIVGLSSGLPHALQHGLVAHAVPATDAARISHLPPVATIFASFLGDNPMAKLLGPHVLHGLPAGQAQALTGRSFFPHLISGPFHTALVYAFVFAIAACLGAAFASLLRGGKYLHVEATSPAGSPTGLVGAAARTKGAHRLYSEADISSLRELPRLRELLGLSLEELVGLTEAESARAAPRDQWAESASDRERAGIHKEARIVIERQVELVRAREHKLVEFADELSEKLRRLDTLEAELERKRTRRRNAR